MKSINPCPFCRSENTNPIELDRHEWAVVCEGCGATGPVSLIPVQARESWGRAENLPVDHSKDTLVHAK